MSTVHYSNDDESRQPDPIDIVVGENLRRLRLARGMSQTSLGAAVGVTFQQIQKYEKGDNRIGASKIVRFAKALKVDHGALFDGTGVHAGKKIPVFVEKMDRADIELQHAYKAIICPKQKAALLRLARTMAKAED